MRKHEDFLYSKGLLYILTVKRQNLTLYTKLANKYVGSPCMHETCRQQSDHFIYSTPALSVLFYSIIACSVLMALLQRYVTKGNEAKNPAIFSFCLLPKEPSCSKN